MNKKDIYDITLPLFPGMVVYPDDPPFTLEQVNILARDGYNVSLISMGSHLGTHIDAPSHILAEGVPVDHISLEDLIGPARVIEIAQEIILPEHLEDKDIREGDRVLFKTRNSILLKEKVFQEEFVYLAPETAVYLINKKVRMVGIDYFSIDRFKSETNESHKILLSKNVVIVEGLNLLDVTEGMYFLIALPLNIQGCDGSPVRAILLKNHYSP